MDKVMSIVTIFSFVVTGAVVALAGIAPLTKTDADDKALGWLRKVEGFLLTMVVPAKHLPPKDGE